MMNEKNNSIRDSKDMWEKAKEPKICPKCDHQMEYNEDHGRHRSWVCYDCNVTVGASLYPIEDMLMRTKLTRYFAQGLAFAVIFLLFEAFWVLTVGFLVTIGSWLGLIIGVVLLMLAMGGINGVIARFLRGFPVKDSLWDVLVHGVALFMAMFAVELVLLVPTVLFSGNLAVTGVRLLVNCFLYCVIGEKVAEILD